jgi:hypothetical protein
LDGRDAKVREHICVSLAVLWVAGIYAWAGIGILGKNWRRRFDEHMSQRYGSVAYRVGLVTLGISPLPLFMGLADGSMLETAASLVGLVYLGGGLLVEMARFHRNEWRQERQGHG